MKTKIASLVVSIAALINAFGCIVRIVDDEKRKTALRAAWICAAILIPGYIYLFIQIFSK